MRGAKPPFTHTIGSLIKYSQFCCYGCSVNANWLQAIDEHVSVFLYTANFSIRLLVAKLFQGQKKDMILDDAAFFLSEPLFSTRFPKMRGLTRKLPSRYSKTDYTVTV